MAPVRRRRVAARLIPSLSPRGVMMRILRPNNVSTVSFFAMTLVLSCAVLAFLGERSLQQLEQPNPIQKEMMKHTNRRVQEEEEERNQRGVLNNNGRNNRNGKQQQTLEYPVEDPIPNPDPPANGNETFSACLLVMDDNHHLVEWLAYHYHVLPLRYMIVTVDPRSKTSPTYLFNRWRRQGMVIVEWKDEDFWKRRKSKTSTHEKFDLKPIPDDADFQTKRDRHRGRQKYFYRSCLMALKEANRTWVTLHDTDEFLVYNHAGGDSFERYEAEMQRRHALSVHAHQRRIRPAHIPPTTADEGAMITYIRQEQAAGLQYYQSPCIGVPRLQFGAQEDDDDDSSTTTTAINRQSNLNNINIPPGLNEKQFDTLQWRKHAPRNDFHKNALGKVVLDVSRIDVAHTPFFQSLHRPIKTICSAPWHNEWESGLRINHYLGSWESYSFRSQDARKGGERSREQWEYKAMNNGDESDDNIRPWLSGFVAKHGTNQAQALLEGAGLPDWYEKRSNQHPSTNNNNHNNNNDDEWSLLPDKLQEILSTNETIANDQRKVQFDAFVREKYKNEQNKLLLRRRRKETTNQRVR